MRGVNLGGGSTITMQLANNISFDSDTVYARKLKEIPFALRIQRELSKEEIITLYLNLIYFGSGADGINAAAVAYYGKPIAELELHQFAMLTSVLPCPSPCNPITDPERATTRRNVVLTKMFEQRMISRDEYEAAINTADNARRHSRRIEISAPYVAEMVRQELYQQYGEDIYRKGFEVTTTIHSEKQLVANRALTNAALQRLARSNPRRGEPGAHCDRRKASLRRKWRKLGDNSRPAVTIGFDRGAKSRFIPGRSRGDSRLNSFQTMQGGSQNEQE